MKILAAIILVTTVLSGAPSIAQADDRRDIQALYDRLARALTANKPELSLAMETPDFKAKGPDGKIRTGKELVQQMKQQGAGSKLTKMSIKIDKLTVKGKAAVADTSFTFTSEINDTVGRMGPKGKKHVMSGIGAIHNDLLKTAQGWKFQSMSEKPGGMMLDGKPFNPAIMAPNRNSK